MSSLATANNTIVLVVAVVAPWARSLVVQLAIAIMSLRGTTPEERPAILKAMPGVYRTLHRPVLRRKDNPPPASK
ncbi:hypothetical protein [Actinomycetospora sp. CA-053990]|uniref:hypothetical protein n=1 Tax=Actinomycetospora sp. CA-053990 TaxID=3239891 RepID=UPI003D8FB7EF